MGNLKMFTQVWGDRHIDWMRKTAVHSLSWPKNKEAIKDATWFIFTRPQDREKVDAIAKTLGVKEIKYYHFPESLEGTPRQMGLIMLEALYVVMGKCLEDNSQLLTAPPDTFFSEGSIPALLQMGKYNTCVAVPHPRVTDKVFEAIKGDDPISSADMVDLLFKYPHASWSGAEIGNQNQCSFVGGIAWQKMGDNLILFQHQLPTIYLATFKPDDIDFFKNPGKFFDQFKNEGEPVYGVWDHLWPSKLVKEQRQRMPGSSDVACILEVTKEDDNVPNKHASKEDEPDAFWRGALHNQYNRQLYYVMRGN